MDSYTYIYIYIYIVIYIYTSPTSKAPPKSSRSGAGPPDRGVPVG